MNLSGCTVLANACRQSVNYLNEVRIRHEYHRGKEEKDMYHRPTFTHPEKKCLYCTFSRIDLTRFLKTFIMCNKQ